MMDPLTNTFQEEDQSSDEIDFEDLLKEAAFLTQHKKLLHGLKVSTNILGKHGDVLSQITTDLKELSEAVTYNIVAIQFLEQRIHQLELQAPSKESVTTTTSCHKLYEETHHDGVLSPKPSFSKAKPSRKRKKKTAQKNQKDLLQDLTAATKQKCFLNMKPESSSSSSDDCVSTVNTLSSLVDKPSNQEKVNDVPKVVLLPASQVQEDFLSVRHGENLKDKNEHLSFESKSTNLKLKSLPKRQEEKSEEYEYHNVCKEASTDSFTYVENTDKLMAFPSADVLLLEDGTSEIPCKRLKVESFIEDEISEIPCDSVKVESSTEGEICEIPCRSLKVETVSEDEICEIPCKNLKVETLTEEEPSEISCKNLKVESLSEDEICEIPCKILKVETLTEEEPSEIPCKILKVETLTDPTAVELWCDPPEEVKEDTVLRSTFTETTHHHSKDQKFNMGVANDDSMVTKGLNIKSSTQEWTKVVSCDGKTQPHLPSECLNSVTFMDNPLEGLGAEVVLITNNDNTNIGKTDQLQTKTATCVDSHGDGIPSLMMSFPPETIPLNRLHAVEESQNTGEVGERSSYVEVKKETRTRHQADRVYNKDWQGHSLINDHSYTKTSIRTLLPTLDSSTSTSSKDSTNTEASPFMKVVTQDGKVIVVFQHDASAKQTDLTSLMPLIGKGQIISSEQPVITNVNAVKAEHDHWKQPTTCKPLRTEDTSASHLTPEVPVSQMKCSSGTERDEEKSKDLKTKDFLILNKEIYVNFRNSLVKVETNSGEPDTEEVTTTPDIDAFLDLWKNSPEPRPQRIKKRKFKGAKAVKVTVSDACPMYYLWERLRGMLRDKDINFWVLKKVGLSSIKLVKLICKACNLQVWVDNETTLCIKRQPESRNPTAIDLENLLLNMAYTKYKRKMITSRQPTDHSPQPLAM
ncbi:uncharacterized protein LOC106471525 isoform X2 [Limulus polyphemus]|uniref:Uncharacterized protein LOC106471525 isoform X2 n=1 Tax=Limulus polyphemus TaxID=6850 RepID=A0ABM1BS30_LIMPO|nr:uncharacterized protein LOC106471525 isoform X2 [Limulus polyphemus]XP_022255844.1 uncharacterized protein LOC106471525 isoform X2 [Limulus polyphemus]XP_022255845.1 uncharacterized protein LOC106471525 isoform X2 [Limulus polyphemus]